MGNEGDIFHGFNGKCYIIVIHSNLHSAAKSADTTKYRLLLETLDKILPTVKLYIVDSSDGSVDVKLFDPSISGAAITANSQG